VNSKKWKKARGEGSWPIEQVNSGGKPEAKAKEEVAKVGSKNRKLRSDL